GSPESAVASRRARERDGQLARAHRSPPVDRVGDDPGRERRRPPGELAGPDREAAARAREPHPAEPDVRLSVTAVDTGTDPALRPRPRGRGREHDRARYARP